MSIQHRPSRRRQGGIIAAASAITLVLATLFAGPTVAAESSPTTADDLPTLPPAAINNPDVPLATILALPEIIQQNDTIRIDPDLDPTLPIIDTNGVPVPGQKAQVLPAAAGGGTITIPVNPATWSPIYNGNVSVTGWDSSATVTYYFTATQEASAYATGWRARWGETWYNLGSTQWITTTVPWGNRIATPKGQAKALRYFTTVHIHY